MAPGLRRAGPLCSAAGPGADGRRTGRTAPGRRRPPLAGAGGRGGRWRPRRCRACRRKLLARADADGPEDHQRRGHRGRTTGAGPRRTGGGARSASAAAQARTYTVQPGDSLIKIARKVYGADQGDAYKQILQANRDKLTDASFVSAGEVLVIPELSGALRAVPPAPPAVRQVEIDQLPGALGAAAGPPTASPARRATYVVQPGDTLSKIARKTLKSDSRATVMSIFHANQSTLSDPDHLPVGAELVIPG